MTLKPSRGLLFIVTLAASTLLGATVAGADVPGLPPGVTLPPRASDTTTTVAPAPATTVAPTTIPSAGQTQIVPAPTTTAAPAPAPAGQTRILPAPGQSGPSTTAAPAAASPNATTTTIKPGDAASTTTVPPVSLTPAQADDVLRGLQKSGANGTAALLDALKPLQSLGMTAQEAAHLGMGQFPVEGLANWTDDFGDPRDGPPPHAHQGNDLFTQFNTPVRAPADGVVRYETGGLGGMAAYVTTADGTYYYMAHLNSYATDLTSGSAVTQGRVVGFAGDSGNAKGGPPHVHFEIHPGGGAAVDPKPIIDGWVAAALDKVPDLIASFQPKPADGNGDATVDDGLGVPQILVATGLTRRFSVPSVPAPARNSDPVDYSRAVLKPLTPPELAPLLDASNRDT